MKISAFIRKQAKKSDTNSKATIYFRLRDKDIDIKSASKLTINPNYWNPDKQGYKDRIALVTDEEKNKLKSEIQNIISLIHNNYKPNVDSKWLNDIIESYFSPKNLINAGENNEVNITNINELFEEFLRKHKISEVRKKNFRVIARSLRRYELYIQTKFNNDFKLEIDKVTTDTLQDIWDYFENEYKYYKKYPLLFESITEKRILQKRGKNTLIDYFNKIRTFFIWCYKNEKTLNRPFDNFKIDESIYGTPIYITLEERDKLYYEDLSAHNKIEVQRDIFIFQSLIGCRISDLYSFTKKSIINDAIEYIPRKTRDGNPITVRVPLNAKAKVILKKYEDSTREQLLPYTYEQDYNESIKKAFELAGINRIVTVLNPTSGMEEKKPIYEIATSHMARRTFIGNLYKKVKDPNLIGALSGHKQGSKAFSRYREIDEDIKKELVNLLD